jgi:hypothetical protein
MASAAFEERMKLELGTETVKKMGKSRTIGFLTEEEKMRVEKTNKEKEELSKLKQENFFGGREKQLLSPPASGERFKRRRRIQRQLQLQAKAVPSVHAQESLCSTTPVGDPHPQPVLPATPAGEVRPTVRWKKNK